MEFATQDADPAAFEPLRQPINDRAAAFRKALVDAEPKQLNALVDFAARAYRRPLDAAEGEELRALYRLLRRENCRTTKRSRFMLARVFVAPAFLVPVGKSASGRRSGRGHRLGAGESVELLPLVVAAR